MPRWLRRKRSDARVRSPTQIHSGSAQGRLFAREILRLPAGFWRVAQTGHHALGLIGEHLADTANGVALGDGEGEEFEAVAQAIRVADDGTQFQWIGAQGKRNFEGDDFSALELPGERSTDAILADLCGASPTVGEYSVLKHADIDS